MRVEVDYLINTASAPKVAEHLLFCNAFFIPPLTQRVHLPDYAQKIVSQTIRFEAWSKNLLIGLVAAYCNDQNRGMAYVTSVSVIREWTGKGIAEHLMQQCISHAITSDMLQIKLEVAQNNRRAIKLYEKCGFIVAHGDRQLISMVMNLKSANP